MSTSGPFAAVYGVLLAIPVALAQPKGAEKLMNLPAPTGVPISQSVPSAMPSNPASPAPIQIRISRYFGWERCLTISNGRVEAVVVPAIGRVMQFRFTGQSSPFWEDPALRGQAPDPAATEWANFGGDKTWPSPQADWDKVTPRSWPPPSAFDSMPVESSFRRDAVVLTSPVDPHYGIRTERVIQLDHEAPVMTITTTYEKVSGDPLKAGVWIITQLEDPVGVFVPVPARSLFPEGYNRQSGDRLPANLELKSGLLSMTRDPTNAAKIGTDAGRLLWVGRTHVLLIESPRVAGAEYPDQQSSAEVYTNPDPKAYVELETLGPLHTLRPGDRISQTNTYTLYPRTVQDPAAEARKVLSSQPR